MPTANAVRREAAIPAEENYASVFYHNDTPIPRTQSLIDELESVNIRPLIWPVRSPDLNPLEHVFGGLARMIYTSPIDEAPGPVPLQQVSYDSLQELKEAIQASWTSILASDLAQEVMMMNVNMQEIEKCGGGHIVKNENKNK